MSIYFAQSDCLSDGKPRAGRPGVLLPNTFLIFRFINTAGPVPWISGISQQTPQPPFPISRLYNISFLMKSDISDLYVSDPVTADSTSSPTLFADREAAFSDPTSRSYARKTLPQREIYAHNLQRAAPGSVFSQNRSFCWL